MTELSPRTPGGKKSTGTNLSEAPKGYPPRFTANAPDLASMNPQTPEEFTRRGWIYYSLGEYDKAESDFRAALDGDTGDPNILYPLGLTLNALEKKDEALAVFNQALAEVEKMDNIGKSYMLRHLIQTHLAHLQPGTTHME